MRDIPAQPPAAAPAYEEPAVDPRAAQAGKVLRRATLPDGRIDIKALDRAALRLALAGLTEEDKLDLRVRHHPPYPLAAGIALLIYVNFWTHHYVGDYRWYLAACALGLYARTTVVFRPLDRDRQMPLLLAFVLIGFFIWLAENIGTFWGVWRYPNQLGAWLVVHVSKWSSWSLLVIMTFTIVANLKHIKEKIHVARA